MYTGRRLQTTSSSFVSREQMETVPGLGMQAVPASLSTETSSESGLCKPCAYAVLTRYSLTVFTELLYEGGERTPEASLGCRASCRQFS